MRLLVARLFLVAVALATSAGFFGTPSASAETFTIVDTLAPATPTTTFSLGGSSGYLIAPAQIVGPRFTLTDTTVVTEIGGFIAMFGTPPAAAEVQIRPEVGGIPGDSVLATFAMSSDGDMFTISYESARPNLVLGAGTYFAMFAPQGDGEGFLLGFASVPFVYQPGVTTLAFGSQVGDAPAAVRILGETPNANPSNFGCPPADLDGNGNGGWTAVFITNEDIRAEVGRADTNGDDIVCQPNQGQAFPQGLPLAIDNHLPH